MTWTWRRVLGVVVGIVAFIRLAIDIGVVPAIILMLVALGLIWGISLLVTRMRDASTS